MEPTVSAHQTQALQKLLSSLEKAFRSYRLYEARGSQYEAHVQELASHAALAAETESAAVLISPYGPFLEGTKPKENENLSKLWFDLFEQGARQITFAKGIDGGEIRELLSILCGSEGSKDDVLTTLWRRELNHIHLVVARILVKSRNVNVEEEKELQEQYTHWRNLLTPEGGGDDVQINLSPDDFRILALEDDSFGWYRECIEPPAREPFRGTAALRDACEADFGNLYNFLLEVSALPNEQRDKVLINLVAAYTRQGMIPELNELLTTICNHRTLSNWSIENLLENIGGIDALVPLVEADPAAFKDTLALFADNNEEILETLLEQIDSAQVKADVQSMVLSAQESPLAFHSDRLTSGTVDEAQQSVNALFEMGTDEAVFLALNATQSPHVAVRKRVLDGMAAAYQPSMRNHMSRLFRDPDAGVRMSVLRFVRESGDRYFLREIVGTVKDDYFARRSEEEQMMLIRALGAHGRLPVINQLFCWIAQARGFFRTQAMRKIQLEAIRVLAQNPSALGEETLTRISKRWMGNKQLRQAARDALVQKGSGEE